MPDLTIRSVGRDVSEVRAVTREGGRWLRREIGCVPYHRVHTEYVEDFKKAIEDAGLTVEIA